MIGSKKSPETAAPAAQRRETDSAYHVARPRVQSRKRLFWDILTSVVMGATTTDLLSFIFFSFLHSPPQEKLSLVCFVAWGAILWLLKRHYNKCAMVLLWALTFTELTIATLLTGWESGYYYYLVMFVPTVIIGSPRRLAYLLLAVLLGYYLTLYTVMQYNPPIQPISHHALAEVQAFNACVLFVMIAYFVFMYHGLANKAEEDLKRLATTDSLTGLFNRRHAREMAVHEVAVFDRGNRDLSYIIADIDHFKSINDRLGHQAGDMVLVAVSDVLRGVTRLQDVLARWGGEEFLFILPGTSRAGAVDLANRVRDALARLEPVPGAGPITMTFGVSSQRKNECFDVAIVRADKALYRGKSTGRNRVIVDQEDEAMPLREQAAE